MRIDSARGFRFHRAMRLLFLFCASLLPAFAATPPALEAALKTFRTDGPRDWSFTQTTTGAGHSRVERYDAAQPEFLRWTLLQEDGRTPTSDELQDYREKLTRRSRGGTAPRIADQLDLATIELIGETPERTTFRCRFKPGESGDETARYLAATIVLHQPTQTIESFVIAATEPFAPTFGVKIAEMRTTMTYSLPAGDRPTLLRQSTTHLRGRAFLVKSLDADMTVTFTDYEKAHR